MRMLRLAVLGISVVACTAQSPVEPVRAPQGSSPLDQIPATGLTYVLSRVERQTSAPFLLADLRACKDGSGSVAEAAYDTVRFLPDGHVYRALARRDRRFADGVENLAARRVHVLRGSGHFTRVPDGVQVVTLMRGGEHPIFRDARFRIDGEQLVLRGTLGGRCGDGSQADRPRHSDWIYAIAR